MLDLQLIPFQCSLFFAVHQRYLVFPNVKQQKQIQVATAWLADFQKIIKQF